MSVRSVMESTYCGEKLESGNWTLLIAAVETELETTQMCGCLAGSLHNKSAGYCC